MTVHHLYVETRRWEPTLRFWEALGFRLRPGWGEGAQRDGILEPDGGGPYVFLRAVPEGDDPLAFEVYLGADLERAVASPAVTVVGPPEASAWGPRLAAVADPDGRVLHLRQPDDDWAR